MTTIDTPTSRSPVQRLAHWFGMEGLPRFSMKMPGSNYIVIVARHDDRIRLVIGHAAHPEHTGGTHLNLTELQATKLRDGLTRLLGDEEA